MKRIEWIAVACLFSIVLHATAWSYQGKIKMGNMNVIPGISLVEEYDDNIYLGNGDNDTTEKKEDDWITHIKPSLGFKYDLMNRGAISLGYLGDFALYSSNSDNDWNSHTIAFKSDYKAPAGLLVGLNNTYINADDPYASENDYKLGQQTKRWSDDLNFKLGYQFADKYRVIGYYKFYKQDYDLEQDYSQDYDNNEVGIGAEMKVMPQTWAFLRYFAGKRDYTSHPAFIPRLSDQTDADFTYSKVNIGLGWDATAKLTGEVNVGYQWNSADNEFDPYGRAYEDKDTWIAQTKVTYLASPKTKFGGDLFRAVRYTGGDLSEFYDETGFGLNVSQNVLTKGIIRAGAGYSLHDYNRPEANSRSDDNIKLLVGFDYYIREWLMAGFEYRYWDRDSNYDVYDFRDNRFLLTIGVVY